MDQVPIRTAMVLKELELASEEAQPMAA